LHTIKAITMNEAVSLQQEKGAARVKARSKALFQGSSAGKGLKDVSRRDEHEYTQEL